METSQRRPTSVEFRSRLLNLPLILAVLRFFFYIRSSILHFQPFGFSVNELILPTADLYRRTEEIKCGEGGRGKMYEAPLPPQLADSNPPLLRSYQVWKGSNIFCCGGRLIFGPDARSLFLTVSLIVAPAILFCSFVSQGLIREFHHNLSIVVVAICAILTAYIVFLLLLTCGRDPGIIPRNLHPPDPEDESDGSSISPDWPEGQNGQPTLRPTKDVVVNGIVVKVKYCRTCMLYRPPRCSHCSVCNNCVEHFDHHCPWVGQCIGKRNYRFFFMFISSTTVLCLYVFTFCLVNIIKIMDNHHCNFWKALVKSPVSGLLMIYTIVCAWFVGGLTGFHLYLIMTNQTTYETFRYLYERRMNPYHQGCVNNVLEIFCSKIPPSKNKFREKVKEERLRPKLKVLVDKRDIEVNEKKKDNWQMAPEMKVIDVHAEFGTQSNSMKGPHFNSTTMF